MISQSTVEDVKASARIAEVIGEFITIKKIGANYECCCMFHEEKTPSFKIHVKENYYKCFGGCGKSGDPVQFLMEYKQWTYQEAIIHLANKYKIIVTHDTDTNTQKKVYVKPVWKNNTELPDKVVKWFEQERKISQATLQKMRVTAEKTWMPEGKYTQNGVLKLVKDGERNAICFNYFRDGELINVKYRDSIKTMRMFKNAELIFYNIDSLKDATEALILEGEPDVLAAIEAGIEKPELAILSVPNGANIKSNNLTYLESASRLFDLDKDGNYLVKKIYLGTDNDVAGRKLREDLAERFGKERCYFIEWKDQKDCNDVLKTYDKSGVKECIAAPKEFPLEGVFTVSSFNDEIDDMYVNGMDTGCELGMGALDDVLRFAKGYITVITGVPNHGKSDALDQIILKLMTRHGWNAAFYSPENRPTKLHFSKLARKLVGKNWFGSERMSEMEKNQVKAYLEGKAWWIKPEKDFTIETILHHAKMLKMRKGIDCFIIDAWNRLEHKYGKGNETTYVNETLLKIDAFCELNNVHCFLVVHPSKQAKDKKTGLIEVPNLYSLSGSAHFYNITANGITVYRDFNKGITTWYVQKVKFAHWGRIGHVDFKYDLTSGRYYEDKIIESTAIDRTNWITGGQIQTAMPIGTTQTQNLNLPPATPEIILNYEDPPF